MAQDACIWRNLCGHHHSQQAACTPVLDEPPRITLVSQGGSIQDSPAPLCSLKPPHAVHTSCWEGQKEELQPGLSILLTCFWGTLPGRRRHPSRQVPAPTSPLEASLAPLLLVALLPEGSLAQLPLPALLFQLLPLLLRSPLLLQPAVLLLLLQGESHPPAPLASALPATWTAPLTRDLFRQAAQAVVKRGL